MTARIRSARVRWSLWGVLVLALAAVCLPLLAAVWGTGSQAPPTDADGKTRLVLVGDLAFVDYYLEAKGPHATSASGIANEIDRGFELMQPVLDRAQFRVANLEGPLTPEQPAVFANRPYLYWSSSPEVPRAYKRHSIDAAGLSNNHALDQGPRGLENTFNALRTNGIRWFGAGEDLASARKPLIIDLERPSGEAFKIAVFGFYQFKENYNRYQFYADSETPGVAPIEPWVFADEVASVRKQYPGIFVIAYPHWGENYAWKSIDQMRLGKELIDAGADLIVGHHGHVLQEMEKYKGKWIIYGIGNFLYNGRGRYKRFPHVLPYGGIVELAFSGERASPPEIRLYPILADNIVSNYQPRFASDDEISMIMSKLDTRKLHDEFAPISRGSDEIGNYLELK